MWNYDGKVMQKFKGHKVCIYLGLPIIETGLKSIYEGPQTVFDSIHPNFETLWLGKCINDNCIFVLKSKPDI